MSDQTDVVNTTTRAELRQLSEHLFVIEDTCNVYLVNNDEAGLLVDAGSGVVAELAADAGVTSLLIALGNGSVR